VKAPVISQRSSGLQERDWDRERLTMGAWMVWVWFIAYVLLVGCGAHYLTQPLQGWWRVLATVACIAVGLIVWRRSILERFRTICTLLSHCILWVAYLTIFLPWAMIAKATNPLHMHRQPTTGWTDCTPHHASLDDMHRQY
jgi:hypothetical protein